MTNTTPRNITRTWKVDLYGTWGEGRSASVFLCSRTVTLSADALGRRTASVDGEPATVERAVQLLTWAREDGHLTLLNEERHPEPVAAIGKPRASLLHKIMGMAGIPKAQHYTLSAAALGEPRPLATLAGLTEGEARTIWAYLCAQYPKAREVAAQLTARLPLAA